MGMKENISFRERYLLASLALHSSRPASLAGFFLRSITQSGTCLPARWRLDQRDMLQLPLRG